jgi:hypothetical protein
MTKENKTANLFLDNGDEREDEETVLPLPQQRSQEKQFSNQSFAAAGRQTQQDIAAVLDLGRFQKLPLPI